jgi:predicted aminopeptidase
VRHKRSVACLLAGAVMLGFLATPTGRYLARAGWEEGRILARRRAIVDVIADRRTAPAVRTQLQLVLDARQFAADSLGLRAGRSFTTFAALAHDTLVLVLSGAYRDELRPVMWWFPIVGSVPYKGYFEFADAVHAAESLERRGFDAYVRPSPAFSTLGWFDDPLVSATLQRDSLELANTVIHELTHNTFYASGRADFNESFANFVGTRGAAAFFRSRGDALDAREIEQRWSDEKTMGAFWTWVYSALDSAFRATPGDAASDRVARLAARDRIYALARDSLRTAVAARVQTIPAAALARARLDNAVLLARRVYRTGLDDFDGVYARCDDDLRRAVVQVIALARANPRDPFGGLRGWVHDPHLGCAAYGLRHPNDRERRAVVERHVEPLAGLVAACRVERYTSQRRAHLETRKSGGRCRLLAGGQDGAPHAASRPVGMHEECADLRGLPRRIEHRVLPRRPMVTAEQRRALAPPTAPDDDGACVRVLHCTGRRTDLGDALRRGVRAGGPAD